MDRYLEPNANYYRLYREYLEHGTLCIGVDFDDTLYDTHHSGLSYEMVRQLVRDLKSIGCKIVIWTANKDHVDVEAFCAKNNIPHDGINRDGIKLSWDSRKPFFSALLDDRAGLPSMYEDLSKLVKVIKHVRG